MRSCPNIESRTRMFYIKDPSTLKKPWLLSTLEDEELIAIPVEVTQIMHNYDIIAVQFLYQNFKKGMNGSILNEEDGMCFPLQVCAFLRAVLSKGPSLVLIISPDHLVSSWHYHLANEGGLTPLIVTNTSCTSDFGANEDKLALLINFSNIKLVEHLLERDLSSVIVDDFDKVANKLIFKHLQGAFNIGLTRRSFYVEPDQKLMWNMLNWSNPGCVGKLSDFHAIDNRNFANLRDNYRFWWMRLTWKFCESFKKPTKQELDQYRKNVSDWAESHNLYESPKTPPPKRKYSRKRKLPLEIAKSEQLNDEINIKTQEVVMEISNDIIPDSEESSSDTIITETQQFEVPMEKYVKLPSMDETPILSSIIENFERSPDPIISKQLPSCSNYDPIFDFLPNRAQKSSPPAKTSHIITIFEEPCSSKSTYRSQSEEFIINLVQNNKKIDSKSSKEKKVSSLDDEIEQVLKEADSLLQN